MATNTDCVNSQAIAVTKLLVPSLADNLLMMVVSSFLNGMSLRCMNESSIPHCGIRDPQPSSGHVNVHSLVRFLYLIFAMRAYPLLLHSSHGLVRRGHKLLVFGTWLLYLSSIVYWAAILGFIVSTNNILSQAADGLSSTTYSGGSVVSDSRVQAWDCIMTAALTVNARSASSCSCLLPTDRYRLRCLDLHW